MHRKSRQAAALLCQAVTLLQSLHKGYSTVVLLAVMHVHHKEYLRHGLDLALKLEIDNQNNLALY